MRSGHVVVIGGYGFFGRRLVERLSAHATLTITIAGRSLAQATALANALQPKARAALRAVALDIHAADFTRQLQALAPDVLIHTGGPFQGQDYRVAYACIETGVHYILRAGHLCAERRRRAGRHAGREWRQLGAGALRRSHR
jgi:saccharopine dehydrogenase-like NADP-dependent oxidoreductase